MANSNSHCFLKIFIFHYKFPSKHLIHITQTLILCAYDDLLRYFLAISATPCAVWIRRSILTAESTHWQSRALRQIVPEELGIGMQKNNTILLFLLLMLILEIAMELHFSLPFPPFKPSHIPLPSLPQTHGFFFHYCYENKHKTKMLDLNI